MSVSSWPARPTNGLPEPVFVGAGRLADEHEPGVRRAGAENGLGAGRGEVRTFPTHGDLGGQRVQQCGPVANRHCGSLEFGRTRRARPHWDRRWLAVRSGIEERDPGPGERARCSEVVRPAAGPRMDWNSADPASGLGSRSSPNESRGGRPSDSTLSTYWGDSRSRVRRLPPARRRCAGGLPMGWCGDAVEASAGEGFKVLANGTDQRPAFLDQRLRSSATVGTSTQGRIRSGPAPFAGRANRG